MPWKMSPALQLIKMVTVAGVICCGDEKKNFTFSKVSLKQTKKSYHLYRHLDRLANAMCVLFIYFPNLF